MQAITSQVQLGAGEALQVIYPYVSWDWGGTSPIAGSYSYEQWMALNVVPSDPAQNTNSSAAASQSGFDQAYQNWYNTLAIGNLATDAHYVKLQSEYNAAAATYTTDYDNASNVWMNQTGGTGVSLAAWLLLPPRAGINGQLTTDYNLMTGLQTQLTNYGNQIEAQVAAIATAYNSTSYQGYVTDPNSGKQVQVHLWDTSPETPYAYVETITNNNFGGNATAGTAGSISFDDSTATYSNSEVYAEGGGAVFDDFITVEAGGSYKSIDWSQFDSSYSFTFSWQDLATVDITPEAWYAGSNITSYAAGPYATGFAEYQSGNNNYFFGPGGALCRIYTKLIVAYRPSVTINASEAFSSYLESQWTAEGGIEIGPFFFESEASGSSQQSTATVSNGNITFTSQADWPLIVGMVSAWTQVPPAS